MLDLFAYRDTHQALLRKAFPEEESRNATNRYLFPRRDEGSATATALAATPQPRGNPDALLPHLRRWHA
jgi:hypothetical protein